MKPTALTFPVFPFTGILSLLFALAIASCQALRVARANPVKLFRNE